MAVVSLKRKTKSGEMLAGNNPFGLYFVEYGKSNDISVMNGRYIHFDTSGNAYVAASKTINKFNLGNIVWSRRLSSSPSSDVYEVVNDPSGNVYMAGGSGTVGYGMLAKWNSSGTIQWQKRITDLSYYTSCVANTTDVYAVGSQAASALGYLVKYNSSGTLQWQKLIGTTNNCYLDNCDIDSDSNIYVVGRYNNLQKHCLLKFNSSGTVQFNKEITIGSSPNPLEDVIVSSNNNNVYAVGWYSGASNYESIIYKFDSSGGIVWQRIFAKSGSNVFLSRIAEDSDNNIYVCGTAGGDGVIIKYNSSGVIQWQRQLVNPVNSISLSGIGITPEGRVAVNGTVSPSGVGNRVFQAYFPADGSETGSITVGTITFTYSAYTGTDSAGTATIANSSQTVATPSYTDASSTESETSTSWTIERTYL